MTSNDFLDVLGKVDDAFVKEAAAAGAYLLSERQVAKKKHTARTWIAAAAFALVVLSCASWLMLRRGRTPSTIPADDPRLAGTSSAPVATNPNATEFVWPEDEFPYPRASILQQLEDMGISLEAYYEMLKHPAYMAMSGDGTMDIDTDQELEAALMRLRIGGLYLGMPVAELLALCGEPDAKSNVGPVSYDDGYTRITWAYYRGEDAGFSLEMIDLGDGYVVNEILTSSQLEGGLPFGMEFGQSLADAEAAMAQCPVLYDARQNSYDEKTDEGVIVVYAAPGNPGYFDRLSLMIGYRHDVIWSIKLGPLYADCELPDEKLKDQEEINRRFESGEITVWLPDGNGWQGSDYREEEAKLLSAQFSVQLPEPWVYDGAAPVAVVDFHNGYAAALFDEQEHGAVYRIVDRDAFEQGLGKGDPFRGLALWEYGQFAPNTTQFVKDPEQVSADWDLNYNVDAPMHKLLAALEKKDAILFRSSDNSTVLFREKKHYVLAYAYGENERITGYARFFEEHSMEIVAGYKVPLIALDEPAGLLGMKLDAVKAVWGEPCFETAVDGTSCPGYLTLSGYVVVLHPGNDAAVTEIELYDHDPTPVMIR